MSSKIRTHRSIQECYSVIVKGAIPEPKYPGQTFRILGESSFNLAKLDKGFMSNNIYKYWLEMNNIFLSAEAEQIESISGTSTISPALGPTLEPARVGNSFDEYRSYITNITIKVLNEYWRKLTERQINIIKNPSTWSSSSGVSKVEELIEAGGPQDLSNALTLINDHRTQEDTSFKNGIQLQTIFPRTTPPTSPGNTVLLDLETKLAAVMSDPTVKASMNNGSPDLTAYGALGDQKASLKNNLDIEEGDQEVFGLPGLSAIERTESQPFTPFKIDCLKKFDAGQPIYLKLFMESGVENMERSRIHFDVGEFLRVTLDKGQQIEIKRKRSAQEVQQYLTTYAQKYLSPEIYAALQAEYNNFANVTDAEMALEAMKIKLTLNNPPLTTQDSINEVTAAAQEEIDKLKTQQDKKHARRKHYRDLRKGRKPPVNTPAEKAAMKTELDAINKEIHRIKVSRGLDEILKRRISALERVIYSQTDSVYLMNTQAVDKPLYIKIVDYGIGVVLFEFSNDGGSTKDIHVFKDAEFLSKNTKVNKYMNTDTNVRLLSKDSYGFILRGGKSPTAPYQVKINGTGGSFTFAYDECRANCATIYIPVLTENKFKIGGGGTSLPPTLPTVPATGTGTVDPEKANKPDPSILSCEKFEQVDEGSVIGQETHVSLITNLPGYPNLTAHVKNYGQIQSKGGTIYADIVPAALSGAVDPKDIDDYTTWYEFNSGNLTDPFKIKEMTVGYSMYHIRIMLTPIWKDPETKIVSAVPILFRGFINILAEADNWDAPTYDKETDAPVVVTPHVLDQDTYNITVEPTFDSGKRRLIYQVTLTYKNEIPDDDTKKIPDFLSGKLVDIIYWWKETPYYIMTDGYITDSQTSDLLTVTQPRDAGSGIPGGIYQTKGTRTTFNATDNLRFLEDKLMSENLIVEGYPYKEAVRVMLRNGGYMPSQMTQISPTTIFTGTTSNNSQNNQKILPISIPGQHSSFTWDNQRNRLEGVMTLLGTYGFSALGEDNLWVSQAGKVRLDGPFNLRKDPRWGNYFIYRSRRSAELVEEQLSQPPSGTNPIPEPSQVDPERVRQYIYFEPITRKRTMADFFSVVKVTGAPDPKTKKPMTIGFKKKEVIAHADPGEDLENDTVISMNQQSHYLGHHKEMPTVDMPEAKTRNELIQKLFYLYNKVFPIREEYTTKIPLNVFLMPGDVIFVEPDPMKQKFGTGVYELAEPMFGDANGFFAIGGASETTGDIAAAVGMSWKVLDVQPEPESHRMGLVITPLNKAEQKALSNLIAAGGTE